jgi:hypothetical protein
MRRRVAARNVNTCVESRVHGRESTGAQNGGTGPAPSRSSRLYLRYRTEGTCSESQRLRALALVDAGWSWGEAAREVGVAKGTVGTWVRSGVPPHSPHKRSRTRLSGQTAGVGETAQRSPSRHPTATPATPVSGLEVPSSNLGAPIEERPPRHVRK